VAKRLLQQQALELLCGYAIASHLKARAIAARENGGTR